MDYIFSKNSHIQKSGVTSLTLTNFRNYKSLKVSAGINPIIITGENGVGKTNILEAISFLTPGRGLRSVKLADIRRVSDDSDTFTNMGWAVAAKVSKGEEVFDIGTGVEKTTINSFEKTLSYDRRIVKIDGEKISSQGDLGNYFSAVWLTPQMDRIFRGGAQPRRSFLDRLVYAFDTEHAKRTATFEHLYKQWSQLLKEGVTDNIWLTSLENNMAEVGTAIAAARKEQIERLNNFIISEPDDVFPNVKLELDGIIETMLEDTPAVDVEERYSNILKSCRSKARENDVALGVNRTDFKVFYKRKNMPAELCSTGEQKSLLISIILAQTKCQSLHKGFNPVLLLDEVVAHLDEIKREALLEKIENLKVQAWITSTESSFFESLRNKAEFFEIINSEIINVT